MDIFALKIITSIFIWQKEKEGHMISLSVWSYVHRIPRLCLFMFVYWLRTLYTKRLDINHTRERPSSIDFE